MIFSPLASATSSARPCESRDPGPQVLSPEITALIRQCFVALVGLRDSVPRADRRMPPGSTAARPDSPRMRLIAAEDAADEAIEAARPFIHLNSQLSTEGKDTDND